ncbi:monocarboxylate transporter 9-like isoform X2 [Homarus americanus]|uniref:monocarboxylate transporter 9-like isoform X2 n=1 Tax=Homarus americanus TaxID=6706 RepID=UPI001C488E56|nr:monocarboxylate transporter 9-like isoform X2 [Homarus americanus]
MAGNDGVMAGNDGVMAGNDGVKAGNDGVMAGNDGVMAGNDGVKAGNDGVMAGNDGVMAGNDGVMAGNDGVKAGNDGVMAGNDGVMAGNDGVMAGNDGVKAGNDGVMAGNDGVMAGNDGVKAGNDGVMAGNDGVMAGNDGVMAGNDGVTAGNDGVMAGNDSVMASNDGVMAGNDGVMAGNDGVKAGNDGVMAGNDGVMAGNDGVKAGNDGVKAGNDGVTAGKDGVEVTDDPEASRIPDGGWGWMVVLGSFIITMLVPLLGSCFGVLFSRYLLDEGSSSATTAWIFNTHCFIWNMMGLIIRPLAKEFGWRNVAIVGSLVTSASVVISAFTPSPEFLFFSFSVLSGMGGGVVVCMSFIILPMYFDRRRGMANAIMNAGVCTGQIVGPPLVRLLQDEYGFKGATLIVGAIMLNSLIGACFFHPVEWHMKPPRRQGTREVAEGEEEGAPMSDEMDRIGDIEKTQSAESLFSDDNEGPEWGESLIPRGVAVRKNGTRDGRGGGVTPPTDNITHSIPLLDLSGLAAAPESDAEMTRVEVKGGVRKLGVLLVRVSRSTIKDLGIFRSPRAIIIAVSNTFFINGYYNFIMMVPFAMQAADHTLADSAWCISVSAVCSLVFRMLMSSLSDWPKFNMRLAYMSGLATTATSILVFPLVKELQWLMVVMAAWGSGVGTTMGLFNLIMVKIMGLENLPPVFGASCLIIGIGFLSLGQLIGVIRDASGSYAVSMWVLSGAGFISVSLWFFMPAAQAYDQRRSTREVNEEESLMG